VLLPIPILELIEDSVSDLVHHRDLRHDEVVVKHLGQNFAMNFPLGAFEIEESFGDDGLVYLEIIVKFR
jgi:hypothetical protein